MAAPGHLDFPGVSGSAVSLSTNTASYTSASPLLDSVGRSHHKPIQTQKSRERPTPTLSPLIEFGTHIPEPPQKLIDRRSMLAADKVGKLSLPEVFNLKDLPVVIVENEAVTARNV